RCGECMTATGRWSCSTITSTPSCTLASTAWMSRTSSAAVMRTVISSPIIACLLREQKRGEPEGRPFFQADKQINLLFDVGQYIRRHFLAQTTRIKRPGFLFVATQTLHRQRLGLLDNLFLDVLAGDLNLPVILHARSGRNQPAHDDVLLQATQ